MNKFHKLTVSEIQRITPNSVTVSFHIPGALKEDFQFSAGQYITIKTIINGEELRRSYSICTTPKSGLLKVGIKKVDDGLFSRFANNELREGDVLEVHPPEGRFIFLPEKDNKRNLIAFAAGSGITPIMSIMKTALEEEPNSNFVLVYGNKNAAETMFHDEILELTERYPERFSLYFIFSRAQEENSLFGRIERANVYHVLNNKHKDEHFNAFYLCGPEEMINNVTEALQENKIEKERIFYELFTTSETEAETLDLPDGKTSVTVMLDDMEYSFIMDKKQRVLDMALKEKLDAPYSCQGGVCSSCMALLKEGEVNMAKNDILTDSEVAEGFILTCQSYPVSDRIVIDYDDV